MKKFSMKNAVLFSVMAILGATSAFAQQGELEPQNHSAPKEIIVRVDAQGNSEVFKVDAARDISDASSAAQAIETYVKAENKVQNVLPQSELDRTSSTESWYYYYNPYYSYNYGYNYSYNYYGYNYYYQPYYNYSYGYYNYYYYRYY